MKNTNYPVIMGILNITPDSFSDGNKNYFDLDFQISKALKMEKDGANIIDIGGESTRPGSEYISIDEELDRVIPVVEKLRTESNIKISIDTNKSVVAEEALKHGANIINDITGLSGDSKMAGIVEKYKAELVLMHMQGSPNNMQDAPQYTDPTEEVFTFLNNQINYAIRFGVDKNKIIIDPGFGFGKRYEDNCLLMQNIYKFTQTGYRVLIGVSRKSMIGHALNLKVNQRVEPSIALAIMSYLQGAQIFRVHDILQTRRALDMIYEVNQIS